ncbi:MAG: hypothetical protein NBV77_06840 [Bacteroidia bacterium]|nr:hypothetical protein [Bacteroidia bacterium]
MKIKWSFLILTLLFAGTNLIGQQEKVPQNQHQIKPISAITLKDRSKIASHRQHPIILSNDSQGIFYLNYVAGDTLMFKRNTDTTSLNYFLVLKDFDLSGGLQHCIIKTKDRIFLLNRLKNSIQYYDCKDNGVATEFIKLTVQKVELDPNERFLRIEKDRLNVYLVSYDFKKRCQKFYLLNTENKDLELLYSVYNPFLEIFFSMANVSNYSFYNNKLALTDFYTGNSLIIDLSNSQVVDSVQFPGVLNENTPTFEKYYKLSKRYNKRSSWANYDSLMNLAFQYNHTINSFFLNDSTLLITARFIDPNSAPYNLIGIHIPTEKSIFKQRRINKMEASEIVQLSNMPIYLGFEESNYLGDGVISVYKELPELNKYNLRDFLNKMEQQGAPKIGTFVFYKMQ